jgi:hypothetical protein
MAYGSSDGSSKGPFLQVSLGAVFGDQKAYQFSLQKNSRIRLDFISPSINADGSSTWDFSKGKSGIGLNWNDACKLYLASKEIAKIHNAAKSGKIDLADPKNIVFTTKMIRVPLVAQMTGNVYGEITVGLVPDPKTPNEETFCVAFKTTGKDNQVYQDSFTFVRAMGQNGIFEYSDGKTKIHESRSEHLGFTDFIHQLESVVFRGKLVYGLYSSIAYMKSQSRQPSSQTGGGSSSGFGSQGFSGNEDIPF